MSKGWGVLTADTPVSPSLNPKLSREQLRAPPRRKGYLWPPLGTSSRASGMTKPAGGECGRALPAHVPPGAGCAWRCPQGRGRPPPRAADRRPSSLGPCAWVSLGRKTALTELTFPRMGKRVLPCSSPPECPHRSPSTQGWVLAWPLSLCAHSTGARPAAG